MIFYLYWCEKITLFCQLTLYDNGIKTGMINFDRAGIGLVTPAMARKLSLPTHQSQQAEAYQVRAWIGALRDGAGSARFRRATSGT